MANHVTSLKEKEGMLPLPTHEAAFDTLRSLVYIGWDLVEPQLCQL